MDLSCALLTGEAPSSQTGLTLSPQRSPVTDGHHADSSDQVFIGAVLRHLCGSWLLSHSSICGPQLLLSLPAPCWSRAVLQVLPRSPQQPASCFPIGVTAEMPLGQGPPVIKFCLWKSQPLFPVPWCHVDNQGFVVPGRRGRTPSLARRGRLWARRALPHPGWLSVTSVVKPHALVQSCSGTGLVLGTRKQITEGCSLSSGTCSPWGSSTN